MDIKKQRLKEKLEQEINRVMSLVQNYKTKSFISVDMETALLLDMNNRTITIISNQHKNEQELSNKNQYRYDCKVVPYADILQVDIVEDNVTVASVSKEETDGVLLGTTNPFAGEKEIKKLQLRLIVGETESSIYTFTFFSSLHPTLKESNEYQKTNQSIMFWYNHFKIYFLNNHPLTLENNYIAPSSKVRISEELRDLYRLVKDGIMTQEEFNAQKKRLLS